MPGIWLMPVSPWQPAQAAVATVLPACTGSRLAGPAACGRRRRRIEACEIGRHFDQRVVAQELDGVVHGAVAAGTGLIGLQLDVEIRRALTGKVGHAGISADAVRAVAAGAGGTREALAVGDVLGVAYEWAQFVARLERCGLRRRTRAVRSQAQQRTAAASRRLFMLRCIAIRSFLSSLILPTLSNTFAPSTAGDCQSSAASLPPRSPHHNPHSNSVRRPTSPAGSRNTTRCFR